MNISVCKKSWSSFRSYSSTEIWLREICLLSRLHLSRQHISQICFQCETTTHHWISISCLRSIHSTLSQQPHTLSHQCRNIISATIRIIIHLLQVSIMNWATSTISWTMSLSLFWIHSWLQHHLSYHRVNASIDWVISSLMGQHPVNWVLVSIYASSAVKRVIFQRNATISPWSDGNKMW